jgi:hypothetical protein
MSKFGSPRPHGGTRTAIRSRRCRRNPRSAEFFLSDCRPLQAVKSQSHGLNLSISHSNPLDAGYRSDRSISHEIVDDTNLVSIDRDLLISFREMMTPRRLGAAT